MNESRTNNCNKILSYIKKYGSITVDEARFKLNIRRCSARIWDIRNKMNIPIDSIKITSQNETFCKYKLGAKS